MQKIHVKMFKKMDVQNFWTQTLLFQNQRESISKIFETMTKKNYLARNIRIIWLRGRMFV